MGDWILSLSANLVVIWEFMVIYVYALIRICDPLGGLFSLLLASSID